MSCQSAAKVVSDIFQESKQVGLAIGCAILTGAGAVIGVKVDYTKCFATGNTITEFIKRMNSFWNTNVSKGSWATIGPRELTPNETLEGTLVATSGRMYIMPYPANKDTAKIIITERDGKAKTSVDVCKFNESGNMFNLGTKWFNDSDERKDKEKEERVFELTGIKNHIIAVNVDAKSVTNKFSYSLRLEM